MLSPALLDRESRNAFRAVKAALGVPAWPEVPIRWNRRLRRAGRAIIEMPAGGFQAATIELSPAYFAVYPADLYGILVHEAVHVGLALLALPFGHGEEFQTACVEAGGLLHSRWLPGRLYVYRCPTCACLVERRRPVSDSRWCADCVGAAEQAGVDGYTSDRALILVRTEYRGPERVEAPGPRAAPSGPGMDACDTGVTEQAPEAPVCAEEPVSDEAE